MQYFKVDENGNLYISLSNPFDFKEIDTIRIGDEDHTEVVCIPDQLIITKDSVVL